MEFTWGLVESVAVKQVRRGLCGQELTIGAW